MSLCQNRLGEERYELKPSYLHDSIQLTFDTISKQWRREHPFGFFARPVRNAQGVLDLKKWECGVPGKEKTLWEGGLFKLDVIFPDGTLKRCKSTISADTEAKNTLRSRPNVRLESLHLLETS